MDFYGKDYKLFRRQCAIYMMANRDNFVLDEEKVLFVLSYMKGGLAGQWAENEYKKIMEDGYIATTFGEFKERLQGTFSDPNIKSTTLNTNFPQHNKGSTRQPKSSFKNLNSTTKQ